MLKSSFRYLDQPTFGAIESGFKNVSCIRETAFFNILLELSHYPRDSQRPQPQLNHDSIVRIWSVPYDLCANIYHTYIYIYYRETNGDMGRYRDIEGGIQIRKGHLAQAWHEESATLRRFRMLKPAERPSKWSEPRASKWGVVTFRV